MQEYITILNIGDEVDYDSYKKLNKERKFIDKSGFYYRDISYFDLLNGGTPDIPTGKVIAFLFFPFDYWDTYIEHRKYRGVYGNRTFYRKFRHFCEMVSEILEQKLTGRKVLLISDPLLSVQGRDKVKTMDKLARSGVSVPRHFRTRSVRGVRKLLKEGYKLYLKPNCGSMGKGITFMTLGEWRTNFGFRGNKITSRKSDKGWKFHDVTGNNTFLGELLKKNVYVEEGIQPLHIKGDKVDLRIYVFMGKALYIYPRRNKLDAVTTNISQGGRGDPGLLKVLPEKVLARAGKMAVKAAQTLGLNMAGIDVVMDSTLKDAYIVDVNMYPGFPKRRTFNLGRAMITELQRLDKLGKLRFNKVHSS